MVWQKPYGKHKNEVFVLKTYKQTKNMSVFLMVYLSVFTEDNKDHLEKKNELVITRYEQHLNS